MAEAAIIIEYITILAPSVAGILGIVVSIILAIKKLADACAQFKESDELKSAVKQLKKAHEDNLSLSKDNKDLKKQMDELLTEITKVKHGDM